MQLDHRGPESVTRRGRTLRLLLAASVVTSGLSSGRAPAAGDEDAMTFRGSFTWINSYIHTAPTDSPVNRHNETLKLPQDRLQSQFRPNLKLVTSQLSLIARPRIIVEAERLTLPDGDRADAKGRSSSEVNEAFAQWVVSDRVLFAYGRQNFQWGISEALSPSNRIVHDTAQGRSVIAETRGRNLARVNLSAGKWFSLVILTEYEQNKDEPAFRAEEEFGTSGLIKPEITWNGGADHFGLVVGARENSRGWVGEYFKISAPWPDGLSVYGDASHQRGSDAWYPVETVQATPAGAATVIAFDRPEAESEKVYTLAVGGLRYDFTDGSIVRLEYIRNDAGWDGDERDLATKAFEPTANPAQLAVTESNLARYLSPGLEIPGRRNIYASLYLPDFLWIKDLIATVRATRSLTDGSEAGYTSFEYQVGDAGTVSWAGAATAGKNDSELRGNAAPTHIVSYRHDW